MNGPSLADTDAKDPVAITDKCFEIYENFCKAGKENASKSRKIDKKPQGLAEKISISIDDMSLFIFCKQFFGIE